MLSDRQKQTVATLALELRTDVGDEPLTPPAELASDAKRWEARRQRLHDQLEARARTELDSGSVQIGDVRFGDVGAGGVTTLVGIEAASGQQLPLERFTHGLAELPARWCDPLQEFLGEVAATSGLRVRVHRAWLVMDGAPPSNPADPATLTKHQRRVIGRICIVVFIALTLFVLAVLHAA